MNVNRYTKQTNTELRFDVEFITPTFLGGADGNAEIRTAPFKSLIRRWWRITNGNLSPEELWQKESELFGSTEKNPKTGKTFGKSKVILSIVDSSRVQYSSSQFDIEEAHKEKNTVDVGLYLGYGAVTNKGIRNYIKPGSRCGFEMKVPSKYVKELEKTLFYINLFGTIGSKSKNGFGSISIAYKFNPQECWPLCQDINKVLNNGKNYPNAIVKDTNGILCWATNDYDSWEDAIKKLCDVYLEVGSWIKEEGGKSKWRNLFGYAEANKRLPSQVILKIAKKKLPEKNVCYYYGIIIHLPYAVCLSDWKAGLEDFKQASVYLDECFDSQKLNGCYGRKIGGQK